MRAFLNCFSIINWIPFEARIKGSVKIEIRIKSRESQNTPSAISVNPRNNKMVIEIIRTVFTCAIFVFMA